MGSHSTITSKGQTTIPLTVREQLKLKPGDRIAYSIRDGVVTITARNLRAVDLAGCLGAPPNGHKTIEEIEEGIATAWAEAGTAGLR